MSGDKRVISKGAIAFHGHKVGRLTSYSDGSATVKLNKSDAFVQAIFNTLVDHVTSQGFVQDPAISHMFHYQLPIEEVAEVVKQIDAAAGETTEEEINDIRTNNEEHNDGPN